MIVLPVTAVSIYPFCLFGEDYKASEGRYIQMRMIIGDYGSNPEKHKELYQTFLKDVELKLNNTSLQA